jgi:hypothetical protein
VKKWIKKHWKPLVYIVATLFIAADIYGLVTATQSWEIPANSVALAFWVAVLIVASGAAEKIFQWWEKD